MNHAGRRSHRDWRRPVPTLGHAPRRTGTASRWGVFAALVLAAATGLQAQQPPAPAQEPSVKLQPGDTPVAGQCLSKEELELNRALSALKRPTRGVERGEEADDQPRFDPNYFVGKWTFEGVLPESPFGPAADFSGVQTIRHVEGCTYAVSVEAKAGDASFTTRSDIVYDRQARYMVWLERDSRGFELLKTGPLGGDAGGYFSHHWDALPISFRGRRIRLQGSTFVASPANYRLRMQISVDGQRLVNFGTIWFQREGAETRGADAHVGAPETFAGLSRRSPRD
jgi:hypothetical protein